MTYKPKVFLTSNVFSDIEIGSNEAISETIRKDIKNLWQELDQISELKVFNGRFPTEEEIRKKIEEFKPEIIGCHLSHSLYSETLENSEVFAISTSTAGYNHIQRSPKDDIIITHTPGVLYETVADYTIAIIMANLRNLVDLHNYIWNNQWTPDDKWDLDQSLSSVITSKVLGIVGLGEIGKELIRRLYPWGIKILYYDIKQMNDFEQDFPSIEFKENVEDIFRESDIVSIHVPLNKYTEKMVNRDLLKLMKKNTLLVNTARGPVLDLESLLDMLETNEIQINIAFDVFPIEPIDNKVLERFKKIKRQQPEIRMILIPHNASADADTRGKMNILFLQDIISIIKSSSVEDLKAIHIIPDQKKQLKDKEWRIFNYWEKND
ncbi:MAG: 2-hydroxyacid dehydrogenase [Promethearchaeota archaeon]|jgi:lactate dehydrogenase-like 2-hydroxyacid dehydrogenase